MEKDTADKEVKKLLIALLMTQGISATTVAKILGVDKATISRMIPVSEIQEDIKKYGKEK